MECSLRCSLRLVVAFRVRVAFSPFRSRVRALLMMAAMLRERKMWWSHGLLEGFLLVRSRSPWTARSFFAREISVTMDCSRMFVREISVPMDCSRMVAREISVPIDYIEVVAREILVPMDCLTVFAREISVPADCSEVVAREIPVHRDFLKSEAAVPERNFVVLYGYHGAAERLQLTNQLFEAAFGELAVVARGQPCLIVGDFNVEPTKIPFLAKGISAGLWVDLLGLSLLVVFLLSPVNAHGTLILEIGRIFRMDAHCVQLRFCPVELWVIGGFSLILRLGLVCC